MADENPEKPPFSLLPEGCLANIISLTSPKDACKAAAVSLGLQSAVDSDTVWERFLPLDCEEIVSRSCSPVAFSTKKELFFLLSGSPLLLDGGKMSFRLSRSTGKKCYMLCARELEIAWKDNPQHWTWTSLPESRFAEVAVLDAVCWLDIWGRFQVQMLSPKTNYAAYLVFKLSENHYGLDCSAKASVKFLSDGTNMIEGEETSSIYIVPPTDELEMEENIDGRVPCSRTDGWLEIELGEFFVGEGDNWDVQTRLFETEDLDWKRGIVVEGIEVRPKEG